MSRRPAAGQEGTPPRSSRYPGRQGEGLRHVSRFDPSRDGLGRPTTSIRGPPIRSDSQIQQPPFRSTIPVQPSPPQSSMLPPRNTPAPDRFTIPERPPTAGLGPSYEEDDVGSVAQYIAGRQPGTPPNRSVFSQPTASSSSLAPPGSIPRPGAPDIGPNVLAEYRGTPENPDATFSTMNLPAGALGPGRRPGQSSFRNPFSRPGQQTTGGGQGQGQQPPPVQGYAGGSQGQGPQPPPAQGSASGGPYPGPQPSPSTGSDGSRYTDVPDQGPPGNPEATFSTMDLPATAFPQPNPRRGDSLRRRFGKSG
jgi:hypothetical protein